MNADQRRWTPLATIAAALGFAMAAEHCLACDLPDLTECLSRPAPDTAEPTTSLSDSMLDFTRYSWRDREAPACCCCGSSTYHPTVNLEDYTTPTVGKSSTGVVEDLDFADANRWSKPLYESTLPFTQYVSPPFKENFSSCILPQRPKVSLNGEDDVRDVTPTHVQRLIELGVTSGEQLSAAAKEELSAPLISKCSSRNPPPPENATLDNVIRSEQLANGKLVERSTAFTKFIASGDAVRLTHSGAPTSTKYPSRIRLDDGDEQLKMQPTTVEVLIQRGFPLGDWNTPYLGWRMIAPAKPDVSNHLAAPTGVFSFNNSFFR